MWRGHLHEFARGVEREEVVDGLDVAGDAEGDGVRGEVVHGEPRHQVHCLVRPRVVPLPRNSATQQHSTHSTHTTHCNTAHSMATLDTHPPREHT